MTKSPTQIKQLKTAYKKFSPLQQSVVQVLSVIYEKVPRTFLVICLRKLNIRHPNGRHFVTQMLDPFIEELTPVIVFVQRTGFTPILHCHESFVEFATQEAIQDNRFDNIAAAVQQAIPLSDKYGTLLREIRINFYRQDIELVRKQLKQYGDIGKHPYATICCNPFNEKWLTSLPEELFSDVLVAIMNDSKHYLESQPKAFSLLQKQSESNPNLQVTLAEQWILRGDFNKAKEVIALQKTADMLALQGWLDFLALQNEQAIAHYEMAMKLFKKGDKYATNAWPFYILALLHTNNPENTKKAWNYASQLAKYRFHPLSDAYEALQNFALAQKGNVEAAENIKNEELSYVLTHSFTGFIKILVLFWIDKNKAKKTTVFLGNLLKKSQKSGYHWLAKETAELLTQLDKKKREPELQTNLAIAKLIKPMEGWQRVLNGLIALDKPQTQTAAGIEKASRLVWFLTVNEKKNSFDLQPREQKLSAKGSWSKGRPIALKRLHKEIDTFDFLTTQDTNICSFIKKEFDTYSYYNETYYVFSPKVLAALTGHPLLFWADSSVPVEVVKDKPELLITKQKSGKISIAFSHAINKQKGIQFFKETPTRLKLIEVTEEHLRIMEIMGNSIVIPKKALPQVLEAISTLSSMVTLHSEIGGGATNLEEVAADAVPHIHLLPFGEGLKVSLLTRPFTTSGPYYRPGSGGETVISEIEGKHLQAKRDLRQEKRQAKAIITACPALNNLENIEDEWTVEEAEDCLEILLELQALGDQVIIEWPEGEKLRIQHQASLSQFNLNIKQQKDWFSISGELKLEDNLVVDMEKLLKMIETSSSRFVKLDDGQFLALTQTFHKHLQELKSYSEKYGKGTRIHPLAAFALEDLTEEVNSLRSDKHWKAHVKRLRESQDLEPTLSSTFQADLRDYQVDGFNWLSRLSHWGVGACLADDMGLGKTIQTLAVMLNHAPDGPCLVVAPTSVCMNWQVESLHFAPTLNFIQFGGNNRQDILDNLQPFDMLTCTYGLLQQEQVAEMLANVHFQMVVLDEAQAIKNFATKRSQAAMNLQGKFKLITTGTPIENHLGELWNLFRFINPGLLGSLEQFNQRYAAPIERNHDKEARKRLKKLIQPFILRRTKNQVLEELPPRTEILLQVELNTEEMAFYEALRRQAIEKLTSSKARAGQKHLQILAEIMKLRRACCNAQLVTPDIPISSSKLNVFNEILEELLENKHKALVFSQFVDHLKILRAHLEENDIKYQYLDGSTSIKERKKRVNAFQAGEGDVFLISLRAGGTGLNLTAADYVIHMDPWWNPAVEDQASDRAHRIGQQRPVTIYRLVAQHTIEEKIVALHHNKRDLAASLLEGSEMSGKVSADELLRLISEE
ncbi:DEAD/DEAH box helicase [Candidatus Parabeggiatoa sp. HSG14]|uniref:DEAD/DEAH box helicase n=1 Tax=Candidatus Parabeggiatoa sp. HSG14 TaxID=3055593 RepID=UPI0025A6DE5D|nr:DEAD/DEAH box helicase [Thiotrichales bacterium HSG14]